MFADEEDREDPVPALQAAAIAAALENEQLNPERPGLLDAEQHLAGGDPEQQLADGDAVEPYQQQPPVRGRGRGRPRGRGRGRGRGMAPRSPVGDNPGRRRAVGPQSDDSGKKNRNLLVTCSGWTIFFFIRKRK